MMNKECSECMALNALKKSRMKHASGEEDLISVQVESQQRDFAEGPSHQLYENSTHVTADAVGCSSAYFRPKSPRPYTNPKLVRGRPYQWRPIDSIRKTRSTALPATKSRQTRGESVSTPHLADNGPRDQDIDEEKFRYRHQVIQLNRAAICYDNIRWICVFLNFVILILSFLYFGSGIAFMYSKEILLLLMKEHAYNLLIFFFHAISISFWIISLSGLYVLWKKPRKIKTHACFTLIFGIVGSLVIVLQNSTEKMIEENLESQLLSSINSSHNVYNKNWDYFHDTFKCCGVTGFLDWCYQANFYSKLRGTRRESFGGARRESFIGTYTCSLPSSCCKNYETRDTSETSRNVSCMELLKMRKMRNVGCIIYIRREIHHLGKMYRVITSCAVGALIFLTIMSTALFTFFLE